MKATTAATLEEPVRERRLAALWTVTYPIIVGNLAGVVLTVADAAMLGRVSATAMAAAALGGPLFIVANMLVTGWATPVQILASRRFGEGAHREVGKVIDVGLLVSLAAAVVIALPLIAAAPFLLGLMSEDESVAGKAAVYLQIMLAALPFTGVQAALRAGYGGIGATKVAMRMAIIINLVNVPVDLVLIFGLGLGVAGSALGSLIAQVAGTAYLAWYGARRLRAAHALFRLKHAQAWRELVAPIWQIGWPETAMLVLGYFQSVLVIRLVSELGVEALAASGVLAGALTIYWTLIYSSSTGISIMIGQRLGAQDLAGVQAFQHAGYLMMGMLVAAVALPLAVAPGFFFGLITPNDAVVREAVDAGYVMILSTPLMVVGMVLAGTLRAAGDTKSLLYAGMIANYAFYLPIAWLCSQALGWGLPGIYVGALSYWVVRLAVTAYRYSRGRWKTAQV